MDKIKIYRNIAKLKSINMFYLDTKTDGPTILCLHGRWGRAETWYDFIQNYGKQFRIIAPDQRGHGLSDKPISKYTAEEMAEDLIDLLNYLNLDSVILVGHSMGGRVAGYLTALYPKFIKGLAILDRSASGLTKLNNLPLDRISALDPLTKDWPLPFSSLNEAKDYIRQATDSDMGYDYFMNSLVECVEGYQMLFSSQAMAAGIAYDVDWFHVLPNLACQVLLIRAKGNEAISDEDFIKMQSMIPNCLTLEMSHPDHNVHLGNKEEFYEYFDRFLEIV
jgi:2-succinyl-6-hydroxy-2,4-cyclohexadiene-1-carboxylate synthase